MKTTANKAVRTFVKRVVCDVASVNYTITDVLTITGRVLRCDTVTRGMAGGKAFPVQYNVTQHIDVTMEAAAKYRKQMGYTEVC